MMTSAPSSAKLAEIESRLQGLLEDGDRILVESREGSIHARMSPAAEANPRLDSETRGKLLIFEKELLNNAGYFWSSLAAATLLIGLIWGNPKELLSVDLRGLQSWWIYTGIIIACLGVNFRFMNKNIVRNYQRIARDVRQTILSSGVSPFETIALLQHEKDLYNVRQQLMADPAVSQQV